MDETEIEDRDDCVGVVRYETGSFRSIGAVVP